MRLTRIKLAGFKSFVDPTTVDLKSDLVAVVGPNGCGKSNIIDAVRWVMGESSAKHLRGDSMTDVIFNGSNTRKPVGQAFVELIFDNSDGTIGGEYAAYSEIAIKRVVNREAQSTYYLNGVRCRRRDITHIFLGTGLGPRSYSIIEQGMISRLIEAKPEELRHYLEETAGISKYNDRRRETKNRIGHTQANLDRVNDLCEELIKQQEKLQRQAKAAEQYKVLKEEERQLAAQVHGIHWRDLDRKAQSHQANVAQQEAELEGFKAEIVSFDGKIEQDRLQHAELNETLQQAQNHFYTVGSEVARLEQELKHAREHKVQLTDEHTRIMQQRSELETELKADNDHAAALNERLTTITPDIEAARNAQYQSTETLNQCELDQERLQKDWDSFNHEAHEVAQAAHGEQTTLTHLEEQSLKANERIEKLRENIAAIQTEVLVQQIEQLKEQVVTREASLSSQREGLENAKQAINTQRETNQATQHSLDDSKEALQTLKAEQISLQALQKAALGQEDESAMEWLSQNNLNQYPRLAQTLRVDPGYERAVETVLGEYLQAVCVPEIDPVANLVDSLEGTVHFMQSNQPQTNCAPQSLLNKVQSNDVDLSSLLGHVWVADTIHAALNMRPQLNDGESIITQDGFWLSKTWLRVNHKVLEQDSVLAREKRLNALNQEIDAQQAEIQQLQSALEAGRDRLDDLELSRDDVQRELNETHRLLSEANAQLKGLEKESQQASARRTQLQNELQELTQQVQQDRDVIKSTRELLSKHLDEMGRHEEIKQQKLADKQRIQAALQAAREQAKADSQRASALQIELNQINTQLEAAQKNQQRMSSQLDSLQTREVEINAQLEQGDAPIVQLEDRLSEQLKLRADADDSLQSAREKLDNVAHSLRQHEQNRHQVDAQLQASREQLNQLQLSLQELKVRRSTIEEQLQETDYTLQALLEELPDEASAKEWEKNLDTVRDRIKRLGAINLAAIEEYEATHERASYLQSQHADLTQALASLEDAIAKIDAETRERFKSTFDTVNRHLAELFPRVFGGGEAYLELTTDDILTAGVTIMARPPGKKNANIHLLSGGEKALTATALVFSLFRLNPSPFCMLDEVDAPLDDTNVGRFCNLVKEMSKSVQFIFITHNKLTMEIAEYMMGVTQKELGASRIVSVDIDEAVELAEQ